MELDGQKVLFAVGLHVTMDRLELLYRLFTPQPLAARGIVMIMTGGRAAGGQDLSAPYLSTYHAELLKISTLVSFGIVVVHGIVGL